MTDKNQTEKKEGHTIVRDFKAPKSLVFEAFSKAEAFAEWWRPVGMNVTVLHFDFKQGGKVHCKMEVNGQTMWGVSNYKNIVSPDLLDFVNSFSDESGSICNSPFPIEFPLEIFNRMTLEEANGITTVSVSRYPINATAEQEATYYSMVEMSHGTAGIFDQLEAYLIKNQKQSIENQK